MTDIHEIPIILNSQNADIVIDNGSTFEVALEEPIMVPATAKYCWLRILNAEVPNTNPNIITDVNDKLYFSYNFGGGAVNDEITFPQGIYDIDSINDEIERQLYEIDPLLTYSFRFGANTATQKAMLVIDTTGGAPAVTIDFSINYDQTIGYLLGYNNDTYVFAQNIKTQVSPPNTARINTTEFFLLHCDLVQNGIRFNNTWTQIIARVIIDSGAGSMIEHRPFNIPKIDASELIGNYKTKIKTWVTDQNNQLINTSGENFTVSVVIYYIQ